jgi:hypothetical protein
VTLCPVDGPESRLLQRQERDATRAVASCAPPVSSGARGGLCLGAPRPRALGLGLDPPPCFSPLQPPALPCHSGLRAANALQFQIASHSPTAFSTFRAPPAAVPPWAPPPVFPARGACSSRASWLAPLAPRVASARPALPATRSAWKGRFWHWAAGTRSASSIGFTDILVPSSIPVPSRSQQ